MSSKLNLAVKLGVLVLLGTAIAGCHRNRVASACRNVGGYEGARVGDPLKFPPGLDAPPTSTAMKLPELKTPEQPPRTKAQGCLDEPPPFVAPKTAAPQA